MRTSLHQNLFRLMLLMTWGCLLLFSCFWIASEYLAFHEHTDNLRKEYKREARERVRQKAEQARNLVQMLFSQHQADIKRAVEREVRQALTLAQTLQKTHQGRVDQAELIALLRALSQGERVETGQRLLLLNTDGQVLLDVGSEEQSQLDANDVLFLLDFSREHCQGSCRIARPSGSYLNDSMHAFVTRIEGTDLVLGAVASMNQSGSAFQQTVLQRIWELSEGKDDYVFAGTWEGVSLLGPAQGRNMIDVTDANGLMIVRELIKAARQGGGYVTYVTPDFEDYRGGLKISYAVGIPEWRWYIGAGVYLDDLERLIAHENARVRLRAVNQMVIIVVLLLLLSAGAYALSRGLADHMSQDLDRFRAFFADAKEGRGSLNPEAMKYIESERLAVFANETHQRRREAEEELKLLAQERKQVIEATNDGIWEYNIATNEFNCSRRYEAMLGYEPGEIPRQGCFFEENAHPEDKPRFLTQFRSHLSAQRPEYAMELRIRTKQGGYKWIYARGSVVEWDEFGQPVRLVGAHTDITPLKRALEELQRAKDEAVEASRMKSEFLANISHEIRTPLNGVLGMLKMCLATRLDQSQREYLELAHSSAHSLLRVLGDVLDLSRIEAGHMELVERETLAPELLESVVSLFAVEARERELTLSWSVGPGLEGPILADADRLRQILLNLLGNAVKFTEKGTVALHASLLRDEQGPGGVLLYLEVADSGVGISDAAMHRIFDAFAQADGSYSRRFQGAGLGLSIVKRLVMLMNGALCVESEPGVGSIFGLSLPLSRPTVDQADARETTPAAARIELGPLRVLLAEDDAVNQKMTMLLLSRLGHEATLAGNGLEVLRLLEQQPFDVILMDIQMPEMDGLETTHIIRNVLKYQQVSAIPIVALTAHAMQGDRDRFLRSGMDGYLSKPVEMEELDAALREAMFAQGERRRDA